MGSNPTKATKFNKMEINVNYTSTKYYDRTNIIQWIWYYKPYTHIRGFIVRIFGVYINVRENNASEKLMAIWNKRYNNKNG